jgi:hypothetical protein
MARKPSRRARNTRPPPDGLQPGELLRHVYLPPFERKWEAERFDDDDLRALEYVVMLRPAGAPVVEGTGGLRKLRYARRNEGKSGGVRVCYVYFEEYGIVVYVTMFAKREKGNLAANEKKAIAQLIKRLRDALERRRP